MAASAGAIRAGSAYVEIFARDGQFQQAMSRIRARMMTLGTQLRQAGTSMTIGGTAMGAPFIFAARTAAAFSLEMARVRANTGATDQQFASLNAAAKAMAVQFGRSPEEVAGAMSELAKAGLDAEGVMKSISPILAVAAADNMELARAVEVAVSTMAQFGMTTNDFGAIADKLQATANASTTSVDSIGEALSYVGPKAQEAGQSFDDVAAAIATLADAGLRGSLGGTGLARVIESIANEEDKLAGLGVSTRDAAGGMRPFIDVLEDLGKKTANMSNVDRIRMFTDIFEIRGANAAMSLSTMRDKFNEVLGTIQNSGGTALGKATAVMSSFGGAVAQLGAQFGVFKIQVIESMGPLATQAVQAFTRMMVVVGDFIGRNGTLVTIVAGSAAALFSLGVAALAAGIALQGLATGMRVVQAGLAVIPALFSPIGLAVAGVSAAIAGGVVVARTLSPAFREETDAIMAALMRLDFGAAWEVMNVGLAIAFVKMQQGFSKAFDAVVNTAAATGGFISDALMDGVDQFMSMFGIDILSLQESFEKLGNRIRWAFDWSFDTADLDRAFKDIEKRMDAARVNGRDANERGAERTRLRQEAADKREGDNTLRDKAFDDTLAQLRDDRERAIKRASDNGQPIKVDQKVETKNGTSRPAITPAPPGAFMPMEQENSKTKRLILEKMPETQSPNDKGISSAGNWTGLGLDVGPEIGRLEDPAQRTADATEQTAEAVRQLIAKGERVSDLNDGQRTDLADRAASLKNEIVGLTMNAADEAQSQLQAKMAELNSVQNDLNALDAFRGFQNADPKAIASAAADPNMSASDLLEKIALGEFSKTNQQARLASPPAVAMDAVVPRAPDVQANAAKGVQAATETSQIGIAFQQVGSDIVAAINAGTEVSKQMLGVINKIAEKKSTELAFQ